MQCIKEFENIFKLFFKKMKPFTNINNFNKGIDIVYIILYNYIIKFIVTFDYN